MPDNQQSMKGGEEARDWSRKLADKHNTLCLLREQNILYT